MKAKELIDELKKGAYVRENTGDTVKAGDVEKEIKKVAFTMFPTMDVLRKAKELGADMLIIHEPLYYSNYENDFTSSVCEAKKSLIQEAGFVIFRCHDYMHFREVDQITQGELHYLNLTGTIEKTPYGASYLFTSDEAVSALELAARMERDLGLSHVRIAGVRDKKYTKIAACFGGPAGVFELLRSDEVEMVLTGEMSEWNIAEYARDAAALGMDKSLIVMGHAGSERDGMRLLAERMKKEHAEFESIYFECGEVYTYTDSKVEE